MLGIFEVSTTQSATFGGRNSRRAGLCNDSAMHIFAIIWQKCSKITFVNGRGVNLFVRLIHQYQETGFAAFGRLLYWAVDVKLMFFCSAERRFSVPA
jgi:hypothetical protein